MLRKFSYIVNVVLSFILIGGTLFVTADFDISILATPDFWWQVIGANIANLLLLNSTAKLDIDKANDKDAEVLERKETIKETVRSSVENDFDDFLSEENKNRKIVAWKDLINNKISKLDKRVRSKDIEIFSNGTEEQKKKNRYCRKRKALQEKLTDDFIDKNIVYLRVKYIKLKRYEITNGCKQEHNNYELTTNISKRILKDTYSKYLFSLGITVFASTFSNLILKDFTVATLIVFAVKLISLFMSIFNGKDYAKEFVSTTLIGDLQFRRDVLLKYLTWKKDKKINNMVVVNNANN